MAQIYETVAKVDVAFTLPDLASALKEIQSQYDSIAARNLQVHRNNNIHCMRLLKNML